MSKANLFFKTRIFVFLTCFLLPLFVYGLHKKESLEINQRAKDERNRYKQLVQDYHSLGTHEKEKQLKVLKEARECCKRAVTDWDSILKDIANQPKRKQQKNWRVKLKSACKIEKEVLEKEIPQIEAEILLIESTIAFNHASELYQKAIQRAAKAASLDQNCERDILRSDEILATLQDIIQFYEEAIALSQDALSQISPYPSQKENQEILKETLRTYQEFEERFKEEIDNWSNFVEEKKNALKEQLKTLKEDSKLFAEKGLLRVSHDMQKLMLPLLETLFQASPTEEKGFLEKELVELKNAISAFEKEAATNQHIQNVPLLSKEEFAKQEQERKEFFFKTEFFSNPNLFLLSPTVSSTLPRAIPLDGQMRKNENTFSLYTDQFYRFLIENDSEIQEIFIAVYEGDKLLHVETIALPFQLSQGLGSYLKEGMLFSPDTILKSQFGLDLRLSFFYSPKKQFSMIVSQKIADPRYQVSLSLRKNLAPLYECDFLLPPPWQLGALRKPGLSRPNQRIDASDFPGVEIPKQEAMFLHFTLEKTQSAMLDQLVEDLKKDPLAIAGYVQNEIAFRDSFLYQQEKIFQATSIHKIPELTYLQKAGNAWEQCHLLVYLLQKAGFDAVYALADYCSLPKDFAEKMLFTQLDGDEKEAQLKYPAVLFFDGKEWISLFPWIKEIQVREGYDLYQFMPDNFATPHRWMLSYLKSDEAILKHVGSDGDDTAGILFVRSVEDELKKQGLSLNDVGIERIQTKKQFSSWQDFPRPSVHGSVQIYRALYSAPNAFAMGTLSVQSRQNPQKIVEYRFLLAILTYGSSVIRFADLGNGCSELQLQVAGKIERRLKLDTSDQLINVSIRYEYIPGSPVTEHTFSIANGTLAALCLHVGGVSSKLISERYQQFSEEKNELKRLEALLAFVGASYFEKCSQAEKTLADLHKVNPARVFAFGLSKLSPGSSGENLYMPQVDTMWFQRNISNVLQSCIWHQEHQLAQSQLTLLSTLDSSANEHQILRDIFKDPYAVSTVKLLQLAHLEHLKKEGEGEGFLEFDPISFELADKEPENAKDLYFPNLQDMSLEEIKKESNGQWEVIQKTFFSMGDQNCWCFAYMTPGVVVSQNGSYKEAAAFICSPLTQYATISSNHLILNGGLGSPLPRDFLTPSGTWQFQLQPFENSCHTIGYCLERPTVASASLVPAVPQLVLSNNDVRPSHKDFWSSVGDPVDVVTGAFYIDETDLILPGAFSLAIRRNYNSQNPLMGYLGYGWKLSLNPFLIEEDGKRFIAELDGTVIVYRYCPEILRWKVFPEDNPELCNFSQNMTQASPYHAYIENDILYGADGSKRFFENELLDKWIDASGNQLNFFYKDRRLSRIESSNGDFCGFHYNYEGYVAEIYAKDGRRISYEYNTQQDLVRVILPNTGEIRYEYDSSHRVLREIKPHGSILENIYDASGKVMQQKSPMGPEQRLTVTAAFDYAEGSTTVTDAVGGKTIYKIFEKQIYKIIDPLGATILQSWFIDPTSWFDPETEELQPWDKPGGAVKSLKSTTDKRGLSTHYSYDTRGNLERIQFQGEDLTGDGQNSIIKNIVYNDLNLCIEEEILGRKTLFIYDEIFSYLPKRIEKYCEGIKTSYLELVYNSQGLVEKEDNSGKITLWEYNSRGLPCQKMELTGTEDPDLITKYAYNLQGQCIEIISPSAVQKNAYDLMGNLTESKTFSPAKALLSAHYLGYDLNNRPIWEQTANTENITYFDYTPSRQIKAKRKQLSAPHSFAYTLYEYNARGDLIEETDPMGYTTYREYNAMAQLIEETKEGLTTRFTYEPGGLVASISSPSGAKTVRSYTTNGLLKEEFFADGTKNAIVYDLLGRPVLETKNDIAWKIQYDDAHHRVIRTHLKTKNTEISEFDLRGNLIRFTDAAGCVLEKTYDGLNRLKTETTPCGKKTCWSYQDDLVICALPNGERRTSQYAGDRVIRSEVTDAEGTLITASQFYFDPENDKEEIISGDERTIIWRNTFGLPVRIEKGRIVTRYEYDASGNCIVSIDGDGRTTYQEFDGLKRLEKKKLPDGTGIEFVYDLDSNLSEYRLPNGNIWKATYDAMCRKQSEELFSSKGSSGRWTFSYENGYLAQATDPMQRTHAYLYDSYGRLSQDSVEDAKRTYTYDLKGRLVTADRMTGIASSWLSGWIYGSQGEHSRVERSYDADGNLILESIYLNDNLLQETHQEWTANSRTLQIGNHLRNFIYQNNRLKEISTQYVEVKYSYNLSGALKDKANRLISTSIDYNASGLPETVLTNLPEGSYQERLDWYPSGKLYAYTAPEREQNFSYDERGYLRSTGSEEYDFDFGSSGSGVRTAAPGWYVPENGLDDFGRVLISVFEELLFSTEYNAMGEVIIHGKKQLSWDQWGRLIKVEDPSFLWEASYDAFGRRLQTRYTKSEEQTLVTNSFYDPEEEFQEIGVQIGKKIFWKIYGPDACDAITDETGTSVFLMHNALKQLMGVISSQGILYNEKPPSAYGPLEMASSIPLDLTSYAASLSWQSKGQDPTGFIWMGDRYYDSRNGWFLSQDSVSYPLCLDLYAYANGDPVNYLDPDGRFASPVYDSIYPNGVGSWSPSRQSPFHPLGHIDFTSQNSFLTNTSVHVTEKNSIPHSNLKLPLTFCANGPLTQTPGGLSLVGHGWIQWVEKSEKLASIGNYPERIRYSDHELAFCDQTKCLTVYVSREQLALATQPMHRNNWTLWDNCVDHVVDALLAIGYPLPNGKKSFKRTASQISSPYLLRKWIEKQEGNIPSQFLPNTDDQIVPNRQLQNISKVGPG